MFQMSMQYLVATICLLAFLTGHSFATFWRNHRKPTPEPDPQYYESFQSVPTKDETAKKLITNFLRIPLSYLRSNRSNPRLRRQANIIEDIVVVLDGSGSIRKCEFDKAKQGLKNMLDLGSEVGFDNKYAAVTFANDATIHFNFVANPEAGKKLRQIAYPTGGTNTQAGLKEAKRLFEDPSLGKRPGVTKVVFLVTDGRSNIEAGKTIPNANSLKNTGVEIFVVAVGDYISGIDELVKVASKDPKDHVFRVESMSTFLEITKLAIDLVAPGKYQIIAGQNQPLCN
ncbi:matrilin-3-like [Oculina patagonica]